MCVRFLEELWPISIAIIYTFSLRLVTWKLHMLLLLDRWPSSCQHRLRYLSNPTKAAINTVFYISTWIVAEMSSCFNLSVANHGWFRTKICCPPCLLLRFFKVRGLCLHGKGAKPGLTAIGVCPCFSLSSINLSAPKRSANQKQNNGTERREVKEWANVNTETEICWPGTPSHTHTVTDLMAKFLSGNNRSIIWRNCPPFNPNLNLIRSHHHRDSRYHMQSTLVRKKLDAI